MSSSTAYFTVTPLSRGKKKLHYFVKAHLSPIGPGIGLPELRKSIVVEVNGASVWLSIRETLKENIGKLFSALGVAGGSWIALLLKRWWAKRRASVVEAK